MVFGQSYAMNYVKPLLWVRTKLSNKLLRGFVGGVIAVAIYYAFYQLGKNNNDIS